MDTFANFPTTPVSPARSASVVMPADTTALSHISRAIYIGQSGDLAVEMADGDNVIFEAVPAGSLLPIRVRLIKSTGTSAAGIISLW